MRIVKKQIEFSEYDSIDQLTEQEQSLLSQAIEVAHTAYAPYSNFKVGAAILLKKWQLLP